MKKTFAISLLLAIHFFALTAHAQHSWGFQTGRATTAHLDRLNNDLALLQDKAVEFGKKQRAQLGVERQRQLLGSDDAGHIVEEVIAQSRAFWENKLRPLSLRIARNPAANCAQAAYALNRQTRFVQQLQLIGDADVSFDMMNDELAVAKIERCRAEASDECHSTGRYQAPIDLALGEERQQQLAGALAGTMWDTSTWLRRVLSTCAVYELHFDSTESRELLQSGVSTMLVNVQGVVPVVFLFKEDGDPLTDLMAAQAQKDTLLGGYTNDPDVPQPNPRFGAVNCSGTHVLGAVTTMIGPCTNPRLVDDMYAAFIYDMKTTHIVFGWQPPEEAVEGRPALRGKSTRSVVEGDSLVFEYIPGSFEFDMQTTTRGPNNNFSVVSTEQTPIATIVMTMRPEIPGKEFASETKNRGDYPVMFTARRTGQFEGPDSKLGLVIDFRFFHKPKPPLSDPIDNLDGPKPDPVEELR